MTAQIETQVESNNPFALMLDPEAVFAAIGRSERLAMLKSRVCRPLDKPVIAKAEEPEQPGAMSFDDLMGMESFGEASES